MKIFFSKGCNTTYSIKLFDHHTTPLYITLILHTRFYTIGCCFRAALVSCLQNQVTSCKKEKVYCKQCFWQSMNSFWIIIEASNFKTNHQWGCWYYIQHTMVHKRDNSRQHATIKVIYPKYYKHWLYTLAYTIRPPPSQKGSKKNTLNITEESDTLSHPSAGTLLIVYRIVASSNARY